MAHQTPSFDLGPQSMLRIIRSARSRLSQDHAEEKMNSKVGAQYGDKSSSRSSTRNSFGVMGRHRLTRSRVSLVEPASGLGNCSSENAAPEKPQHPINLNGGGVLGDITNVSVMPPGGVPMVEEVKPVTRTATSILDQLPVPSTSAQTFTSERNNLESGFQNADDPQHVMEYVPDIYELLHRDQSLHVASSGYMDHQMHVNAKMRGILIDWLVSVSQKYKLKSETLFLAVSLTDRYLDKSATARQQLQLVGITSLLIAAKFEEIHPPKVEALVWVCDKAYSKEEVVKMEVVLLSALDFQICTPTSVHFLERYQSVNECTETHRHLAQYLLELTLMDYDMIKYQPSHLAAAAVLLSNKLLRCHPHWKAAMAKHAHISEQSLVECSKAMCAVFESAEQNSLQAVRKKYSHQKYNCVSKMNFMSIPSPAIAMDEPLSGISRRSLGPSRGVSPRSGAPPPQVSSKLVGQKVHD